LRRCPAYRRGGRRRAGGKASTRLQARRSQQPRYTRFVDSLSTRRLKLVGWVNLVSGLASPLRMGFHAIAALQVFSYSWCAPSLWFLFVFGTAIGILTGASGWGLLKQRGWARKVSCIAGGLTLGYCAVGVLCMAIAGVGGHLEVLIRHGSINWVDWSISHFQSPSFVEIPWSIWWIGSLIASLTHPEPRNEKGLLTNPAPAGIGRVVLFAFMGGMIRWIQIGIDLPNYSQR
jgi:hypothetical protein